MVTSGPRGGIVSTPCSGEPAWFDVFFPENKSKALFDTEGVVKNKIADMELIGKYFNQRLATAFAGVAPNPYTLRNTKNAHSFSCASRPPTRTQWPRRSKSLRTFLGATRPRPSSRWVISPKAGASGYKSR